DLPLGRRALQTELAVEVRAAVLLLVPDHLAHACRLPLGGRDDLLGGALGHLDPRARLALGVGERLIGLSARGRDAAGGLGLRTLAELTGALLGVGDGLGR